MRTLQNTKDRLPGRDGYFRPTVSSNPQLNRNIRGCFFSMFQTRRWNDGHDFLFETSTVCSLQKGPPQHSKHLIDRRQKVCACNSIPFAAEIRIRFVSFVLQHLIFSDALRMPIGDRQTPGLSSETQFIVFVASIVYYYCLVI